MIKNINFIEFKNLILIGFLPALIFNFGNLSNYFYQMIAARIMNFENFGLFNEFNVYLVTILSPFVSLPLLISKFVTEHDQDNNSDSFFIFIKNKITKISFIYIGFILIVFYFYAYENSIEKLIAIFITLINSFLSIYITVYFAYLNGKKKYLFFSIATASPLLLKLIFLFAIYIFFKSIVFYFALITTFMGILITLIFLKLKISFKNSNVDNNYFNIKPIIKYLIPITLTTIFITLNLNMDILLIKEKITDIELGKYSASSILGKAIFYLLSIIPLLIFPEINSDKLSKNKSIFIKINLCLIITLIIISLGFITVYFFGDTIIAITFGAKYKEYYFYLLYTYIIYSALSLNNIIMISLSALSRFKFLYLNYISLIIFIFIFFIIEFELIKTLVILSIFQLIIFIYNYIFLFFNIKNILRKFN